MKKTVFVILLSLALFAAACQGEEPELAFTPETPLPQLTPGFQDTTPTPDTTLTPSPQAVTPEPQDTPTPAATPTPDASPTPEIVELDEDAYLASNHLGIEVRTRQGVSLGQAMDLVADLQESHVRYAVISMNDPENTDRMALVPYAALSFEIQSDSVYFYYLEIEEQILQNTPETDLDEADFTDPEWDRELVVYWQQSGVIDEDEQVPDPTPTFLTPTPGTVTPRAGRTAPPGWNQPRFVLMSVLLEAPITALVTAPSPDPTPVRTPALGTPVRPMTPTPGVTPTTTLTETPDAPGQTPTPGQDTPTPEPTLPATPSPTPVQPGATPTPTPGTTPTPGSAVRTYYVSFSSDQTVAAQLQAATPTPRGGGGIGRTPVPVREVGEVLGAVYDVIMDPENGEILYILVLSQEQWIPVPLEAFTVIHQEGRLALEAWSVLRIDRAQLAGAPRYELGQLPDLTGEDWDAGIRDYWDIE